MEMTYKLTKNTVKLDQMVKSLKQINSRHIRFGWLDGKIHPKSGGLTIAQVAHFQEYGVRISDTASIPSRPYFRQAINKIRYAYYNKIRAVYVSALNGSLDESVIATLSREVVKDYNESVLKQNYRKLSEYTISIKGHSFQMDHSGVMLQNFKAKVYRQNIDAIKD